MERMWTEEIFDLRMKHETNNQCVETNEMNRCIYARYSTLLVTTKKFIHIYDMCVCVCEK